MRPVWFKVKHFLLVHDPTPPLIVLAILLKSIISSFFNFVGDMLHEGLTRVASPIIMVGQNYALVCTRRCIFFEKLRVCST